MIRRLIALISLVIAMVFAAHADTQSLYTVKDIKVSETATNVIEAQQNAFAVARRLGAQRMIERITLPEERARAGGVAVDNELAQRLAAAVDVQEETRGGGRYVATLAVVLRPSAVRAYLRERNIAYIDTQAPMALLVPLSRDRLIANWQGAWGERDDGALAPYVTAEVPYATGLVWDDIQGEVGTARARRGVIAELSGAEGAFSVRLSTLTASGTTLIGVTPAARTMGNAVAAASAMLDDAWRRQSTVTSRIRTLSEATVLYNSLPEWNTLRAELPRSPFVSDFQIKAVSSDGAVVQFAFAGDTDRLMADLRQRGVSLDLTPAGWTLTSAVTGIR